MIASCGCITDGQKRELKEHGSVSFPVACYACDPQTVNVPWHWHDELEAVIVEKGSAVIEFASAKKVVAAGSGCFINAGVLHSLKRTKDTEIMEHSIIFHPLFIGGSRDSIFWQKYILPLISDFSFPGIFLDTSVLWQKKILSLIRKAWDSCAAEEINYEIITRNALSECIGILCGQHPGAQQRLSQKMFRQNERMKVMLSFIQQNFREEVTVRQIAFRAAISESECMRCFRETIGMSPIAYLKNYRLQCAAEQLRTTDLSVSMIGEQCGFGEMSYFSRAFRSLYGCTPSQYRKRNKNIARLELLSPFFDSGSC